MTQDSSAFYRTVQTDGVTIVTILDPELLCEERERFYGLANDLGSDSGTSHVVLNLENLRSFKSMMLGTMISFQKQVKDLGKSLRLCSVDPDVLRVFELTKLDQIFEIQADEAAAINAIQGKSGGGWLSRIFGSGK